MMKLHKDLPKAKTPHVWADGSQPTAEGLGRSSYIVLRPSSIVAGPEQFLSDSAATSRRSSAGGQAGWRDVLTGRNRHNRLDVMVSLSGQCTAHSTESGLSKESLCR